MAQICTDTKRQDFVVSKGSEKKPSYSGRLAIDFSSTASGKDQLQTCGQEHGKKLTGPDAKEYGKMDQAQAQMT